MIIYASNIVELYRYTIISYLGNSGATYVLLRILQCCIACAVDDDIQCLPMVLYYSGMIYINIPVLNFTNQTQRGRKIYPQ